MLVGKWITEYINIYYIYQVLIIYQVYYIHSLVQQISTNLVQISKQKIKVCVSSFKTFKGFEWILFDENRFQNLWLDLE